MPRTALSFHGMTRCLAAGLLSLLLLPAAQAQQSGDLDLLRQRALELVNQSRAENDLPELALGDNLDAAAQNHADDMLARDYYAHSSPEGDTVQDRYIAAGGSRWELVAENIASCDGCTMTPEIADVERLHRGWMNSPGHRANILSEGLARFGFGIVAGGDRQLYAVQTFAGPGLPRGHQPGEPLEPVQADDMSALLLETINSARREADIEPLRADSGLAAAARSMVPSDFAAFSLNGLGNIFDAVPEADRADWARLSTLAGECGGCGTEPTRTDIEDFATQWLEQPSYRQTLLDPQIGAAGFVLRADGQGRKIALLILGTAR